MQVNDVILINMPNTSILEWPMGIIIAVHPDSNGFIRVVDVKTTTGEYRCSVQQLVKLPINA